MLDGKGFYRGSAILYTGTAGTGKTSFAADFVDAACRRGEKCLYIAMEETQDQIVRNMQSIGLDLEQWVKKGLLEFYITRPALYGLEMHIVMIEDLLKRYQPKNLVMDPISDFTAIGGGKEVKSMLVRLQDLMKEREITCVYTDLITGDINTRQAEVYISSMIDTWIMLRNMEFNGERNRSLTIIKSRGMPHSNQLREFKFSDKGIDLIAPYIGPAGVLMGSAKVIQEAKDKAQITDVEREIEHKRTLLAEKRREYEARRVAVEAEFHTEEATLAKSIEQAKQDLEIISLDRSVMARERKAEPDKKTRGE